MSKISDKTREFANLITTNPDLEIVFMVDYEVCVCDDWHWWMGNLHSTAIEQIYNGVEDWGDSEKVYIQSKDMECLIYYIAEYQNEKLGEGVEDGSDLAYELAEKVADSLPWRKVIVVYIGTI